MNRFRFLTGSYTEEDPVPGSRGKGIQLFELDPQSGTIEHLSTFAEISNPSWVAVSPSGKRVAVASEHLNGESRTCLLKAETDGSLSLAGTVPSGDCTCHAAFSPDGRLIATAAYMGGEVQLMEISGSGFAGDPRVYAYSGRGHNHERQESPHAHQVVFSPDGRFLYVTDLGTDRIWCHRIDDGRLSKPVSATVLPAGEGPRHMAVDWERSLAFVLGELTGNLHLLTRDRESGVLKHVHAAPTLPGDWNKTPSAAAVRLHPTQPVVHVSNRNGGLLSSFRLDPDSRRLEAIGMLELGDPSPRDFNISPDGRWVVVGGQESGNIYIHPIDSESGCPGPVHAEVSCPSVVCIAWINPGE